MIYEQANYLAPIDYIVSSIIREYDISKANISIFFKYGVIDKDTYEYYKSSDRMSRQIAIGIMIKNNPDLSKILKDGITQARKEFFISNNIQDHEVLSIKNDAIYLIGREVVYTDCSGIIFNCKSVYTSFYKIKKKEYYYYYDRATGNELLDIKGMSSERLMIHKDYFMDFLKELFYTIQCEQIESAINLLNSFYDNYINMNLPIEYYRNFDGESRFSMKCSSMFTSYVSDFIKESNKDMIDISYNMSILMELNKIVSGIYFQRNRR